jgi:hypothetical protein
MIMSMREVSTPSLHEPSTYCTTSRRSSSHTFNAVDRSDHSTSYARPTFICTNGATRLASTYQHHGSAGDNNYRAAGARRVADRAASSPPCIVLVGLRAFELALDCITACKDHLHYQTQAIDGANQTTAAALEQLVRRQKVSSAH